MARFRRHFLWIALALSVLVHFAPVTGPKLWRALVGLFRPTSRSAGELGDDVAESAKTHRSKDAIQAARRVLVDQALANRKAGKLELGRFVLDADTLDAEEERVELDTEEARRLYDARMNKLARALEHESMPRAIERAFDDLAYSTAVNRMSNMLLTKVGACGPTAQLMAAAAYDLGQRHELRLRYWGGVNDDGATHLTATWQIGPVTYDLTTGAPVFRGGSSFFADEIIEAYARAHGLLPPLPDPSGKTPSVDAAARASFAYPPNADVFVVGETPLFAEARQRSLVAPASANALDKRSFPIPSDDEMWRSLSWPVLGAVTSDEDVTVCSLDPRALDAKNVAVFAQSGATSVQVIPVLSGASLAYLSRAIATYERLAPKKTSSERVLSDACLALSYPWAAERFVAAGFLVIGNEAARRGERHRESAERGLAALRKTHGTGLAKQFPQDQDHWALILLDDGQNVLFEIETKLPLAGGSEISPYWAQDRRTRALLLQPKTRQRLLDAAPSLPLDYRMHLVGAIASLELGGSDLELPKDGLIPRAYVRYRTFIEGVRERPFDPVAGFDAVLEVMKAAGASDKELADKKRELTDMKQQLERRRVKALTVR